MIFKFYPYNESHKIGFDKNNEIDPSSSYLYWQEENIFKTLWRI